MSKLLSHWWQVVGVRPLRMSVYHPQTNGLVEHFNGTLKCMLCKFSLSNPCSWHHWLLLLLFAVREVPQASISFSPFELLYGRKSRGVLDLLQKEWGKSDVVQKSPLQCVSKLKEKLKQVSKFSQQSLGIAQARQQPLRVSPSLVGAPLSPYHRE